jgi:hypothetical protein
VQVDRAAELGRQRQGEVVVGGWSLVQVGAAAYDVGAQLHRRPEHRPQVGAFRSGQLHGQSDQLQVDHVAEPLADLQQRLDRGEADRLIDADVGAYGGGAVRQAQQGGLGGPGHEVLAGNRPLIVQPGVNGAVQIATGVGDAIGRQGGVEVGMWFGRGRQQQVPAQVQALGGRWEGSRRPDRLDSAALEANVDDLARDQPHALEEQVVPATGAVRARDVGD